MAIYTCPGCSNKFYVDVKDTGVADFQREFRCCLCGATYNDVPMDSSTNKQPSEKSSTKCVEAPTMDNSSTVGVAIKGLSIVVLILCVLGAIVVIGEALALGLAVLIFSILLCLLSYGIGEIICLLKDIRNRLK